MMVIPTEYNFLIYITLYLIGSIPFSVILSYFFGLSDPRTYGSNNPGATNVMRSGHKTAAGLTLFGDLLKGFIPVYFLLFSQMSLEEIYLLSFLIFFGHIFSIFINFRGGKAVATSIGVVLGIDVFVGILVISTWLIVFMLSRTSSISALAAFILLPSYFYFWTGNDTLLLISFLNTLLILLTHRSNIKELISKNC